MVEIKHLYSVSESLVVRWSIDEPVVQVLREIDAHHMYQHLFSVIILVNTQDAGERPNGSDRNWSMMSRV